MRRFARRLVRGITQVLVPAFLEDRAQRVERGPVDAELARDLRERREGRIAGATPALRADGPGVDEPRDR